MPEAQLTEPLDRAADKGGLEEMFAALEAAASSADVSRTSGSDEPQQPPDAHLTMMSCTLLDAVEWPVPVAICWLPQESHNPSAGRVWRA